MSLPNIISNLLAILVWKTADTNATLVPRDRVAAARGSAGSWRTAGTPSRSPALTKEHRP